MLQEFANVDQGATLGPWLGNGRLLLARPAMAMPQPKPPSPSPGAPIAAAAGGVAPGPIIGQAFLSIFDLTDSWQGRQSPTGENTERLLQLLLFL